MKTVSTQRFNALPGFKLSLGYTLLYLAIIVVVPLSSLFIKTAELPASTFWSILDSPRVLAACRLSFGVSLVAAAINAVFGLLVAWVLVRYDFPGKRFIDATVELPFALPTSVAGIALTAIYAENGWLGSLLQAHGVKVAFTPLGIVIALTFVGLPFVIRTVQPVLADIEADTEEAAYSLGAGSAQTFARVTLPALYPALLTGFALALARGIGEYGSVIFIAGNMPMVSEIAPLLIVTKLEQYNYSGATAIAFIMLVVSFALLLLVNTIQSSFRQSLGASEI